MAVIVEKNTDGTAEVLSRHLKSGALAIIPCDTIYGIVGVVPSSESALRTVKGRPETKPFIQLVTLDMAKKIAVKPIPSEFLALWPGPLTVVVESVSGATVAIRVSADTFLQQVLEKVDAPLYVKGDEFQGTVPSTIIDMVKNPYVLIRK